MSPAAAKVLVIGYGNPGRLDDGLGPGLADALEKLRLPGVTVQVDYQLSVEDAVVVAEHDVVVFADASVTGPEPFFFDPVEPNGRLSFSSHSVAPPAVLALAHELFDAGTEGYVLGIRGYRFDEFGESLSQRAQANLAAALQFLQALLLDGAFRSGRADPKWSSRGPKGSQ